jgi:RNA polymerase sigma-70 factor (ECF subfamily)
MLDPSPAPPPSGPAARDAAPDALPEGRPERTLGDLGAAWMLAWQAGDEGAFERIVHTYSGAVWKLLTRFLGAHESREDLVQEVFLRVVRARDRYEPSARFTTWLYRIVYHIAVNATERARDLGSLDALASSDSSDADRYQPADERGEAPDGPLLRQDVVSAVRSAVAALPETQRMALVLAKYDGLPYAEIANVLGTTEKAVKSLVHRAREALREHLIPFLERETA